ncbi:MAG: hypothetical protein AYL28_005800 [Candidatus Bathyarchaeota archaeon B23]|nr:MAG: hypothetical protein AYL28_005800 [Candidatus Bathyarchaeota archaeon B23]
MKTLLFDEGAFDRLFDTHLRPLKSKMARTIYRIFMEKSHYPYLTTLDIQSELSRRGIDLDKKEINAWLKALMKAELIDRGERQRPVTMEYRGRYTYITWSLTSLGREMAKRIAYLLGEHPPLTLSPQELSRIHLEPLLEAALLLRILRCLHQRDDWMSLRELGRCVAPTKDELEKTLERYLREKPRILESREGGGLLAPLLRLMGYDPKEFRLGEEGKRIIEALLQEALGRKSMDIDPV